MTLPGCWSVAGSSRMRTPAPARTCCAGRSPAAASPACSTLIMPSRRLCGLDGNGPGHGCAGAVADGIIQGPVSEVLEEFQERVRRLVAFLPAAGRGGFPDRLLLLMHVGMKVGLCAGQGLVSEPEGDHGDVDP